MRRVLLLILPVLLAAAGLMAAGSASAAPSQVEATIDLRQTVTLCNGESVELVGTARYTVRPRDVHIHVDVTGTGDRGGQYAYQSDFTGTEPRGRHDFGEAAVDDAMDVVDETLGDIEIPLDLVDLPDVALPEGGELTGGLVLVYDVTDASRPVFRFEVDCT